MLYLLILKYGSVITFILSIHIKPQHAFTNSGKQCTNKKITCLDEVTYRFCFNTATSTIVYGGIKHCPNFTTCLEDKGELPCIKQDTTKHYQLRTPIQGMSTIKTPLIIAINSTVPLPSTTDLFYDDNLDDCHSTFENIHTKCRNKKVTPVLNATTNKKMPTVTPKYNKKSTLFLTTLSSCPKRNTTEAPQFKGDKHRDKTLLTRITNYLTRLKKKYYKKRKPMKKRKNPVIKSNSFIIKTNQKPVKNISKNPIKRKKYKKPTTILPVISSKKPTQQIKHTVHLKEVTVQGTAATLDQNIRTIATNSEKYIEPIKFNDTLFIELPILNSTLTTEVTQISNENFKTISSITPSRTTSLTFKNTKESLTVATTLTPQLTIITSTIGIGQHVNINAIAEPPTTCNSSAKYPAQKCNVYYECKKIMWWYRLLTIICKRGEAFDSLTLSCKSDINCL